MPAAASNKIYYPIHEEDGSKFSSLAQELIKQET